mmetsp:Transcript_17948/g.41521  ORF Transcript_17948/g.41521 Transcript_17948/m.41521 type:complete len:201 (-) Transcript_17948:1061-1663(-)
MRTALVGMEPPAIDATSAEACWMVCWKSVVSLLQLNLCNFPPTWQRYQPHTNTSHNNSQAKTLSCCGKTSAKEILWVADNLDLFSCPKTKTPTSSSFCGRRMDESGLLTRSQQRGEGHCCSVPFDFLFESTSAGWTTYEGYVSHRRGTGWCLRGRVINGNRHCQLTLQDWGWVTSYFLFAMARGSYRQTTPRFGYGGAKQ